MLPFLIPLLGSTLGPLLGSSLGMAPWLSGALGSGLLSLATERDPQKALMSALTGGLLGGSGGLSNLFKGGADAATAGASAASAIPNVPTDVASYLASSAPQAANPVLASLSPGARAMADALPQLAAPTVANLAPTAAGAAANGGIGGLMATIRAHPLLATAGGGLALASLGYKGADEVPLERPVRRSNNHYEGVGPVNGIVTQPAMMSPEDYLTYGQSDGSHPAEANMFEGQDSWDRTDPLELVLGKPLEGDPNGSPATGDGDFLTAFDRWLHRRRRDDGGSQSYKEGGYVGTRRRKGPGGGQLRGGPRGTDKIQGVVDGKQPVRLNSGEYVFSKEAVRAAGGTPAMDALHNKLKGMSRGRQRNSRGSHRAAV